MKPFESSVDLLDRPEALRERAERDGCLFFRGLLPAEPLRELRRQILELCARHGWLAEDAPLEAGMARGGVRFRENQPEYMALYDELQRLETFHALAHQPPLLAVLRSVLGEEVLVHPRNIARVMFPQNNEFTTPAHQDYVHIQGTEDVYTAWIPLSDCPRELGGLEVLPGSHRFGVLPVRSAYGAGGLGVETDDLGLEWVGGGFRCGDVLLFHSLCVHRGTNNQTPDRLRLSVDYRYQGVSQPVVESSLLPHFNRVTWEEIYQGWEREELQYYWKRPPLRMAEFTRQWHASAGRA